MSFSIMHGAANMQILIKPKKQQLNKNTKP